MAILYIYSERQKTWVVYFDNNKQQCVSLSVSLDDWEMQLPGFWRINKSYLINPGLIYRFHPAESSNFPLPIIELITGRMFAVSYQKTKAILQKWKGKQRIVAS